MGRFFTYPNSIEISKIAYSIPEVKEILQLSHGQIYRLLEKKPFPIIIAVRTKLIPIKTFHVWVEEHYPYIDLPKFKDEFTIFNDGKKSYSVLEIRKMLGMKKTSSYELMKTGALETVIVNEHIRVKRDSFEAWFHSQDYLYINKEEK